MRNHCRKYRHETIGHLWRKPVAHVTATKKYILRASVMNKLRRMLLLQLPRLSHHVVKVDVLIDRRTHSRVVVQKFLLRHLRKFTALYCAIDRYYIGPISNSTQTMIDISSHDILWDDYFIHMFLEILIKSHLFACCCCCWSWINKCQNKKKLYNQYASILKQRNQWK